MLSETGVVCMITCTDGTTYNIYSCVKGKLVEVNDRLVNNISLVTEKVGVDKYMSRSMLSPETCSHLFYEYCVHKNLIRFLAEVYEKTLLLQLYYHRFDDL